MAKLKSLELNGIQHGHLRLPAKHGARLSFSFAPSSCQSSRAPERIVVFLSGLDNPTRVWQPTVNRLVEFAAKNSVELPPMLFYDRLGVGNSDPDPTDVGKHETEYHDCNDSVSDLRELIIHVLGQKFGLDPDAAVKVPIVFCTHSFGVCVARFYTAAYPGVVEGLLLMDSAISAILAEKIIPDPDIPEEWDNRKDWDGWELLDESVVTADRCRQAIDTVRRSPISGHSLTTREKIRWDNMPQLLPYNDRPKLRGPTASHPLVTVIVGDPVPSAAELSKGFQLPESLVNHVIYPTMSNYKAGLPKLQGRGVGKGPIIAKGSGHMVQLGRPDLVAQELLELIAASSQMIESRI